LKYYFLNIFREENRGGGGNRNLKKNQKIFFQKIPLEKRLDHLWTHYICHPVGVGGSGLKVEEGDDLNRPKEETCGLVVVFGSFGDFNHL
jgi:hypothetical protein